MLDAQLAELLDLLVAQVGEQEELYSLVYNRVTVLDLRGVEDDEDPLWRVL